MMSPKSLATGSAQDASQPSSAKIELSNPIVDRKMETLGALTHHFGFTKFRDGQQEALISMLEMRDTFANLPTGSGKSLIFQLLALMTKKSVIVITPTVALVEDQMKHTNPSLKVASTGAALGASKDVLSGEFDVIFMNPEWFWPAEGVSNVPKLEELHQKRPLAAVVIDEAHLALRWSSFRKGFEQLAQLKEHLPDVPTLLMTATVKKAEVDKLATQVGAKNPKVIRVSMVRENLNLQVNSPFPFILKPSTKLNQSPTSGQVRQVH
jgi:ATP-dependent DNA helicase RecQ